MKISDVQQPDMSEEFSAHRELRDAKTYRIYFSGHWFWRYDVTRPGGSIFTVTMTRWGALRAIARDANRKGNGKWWEQPYVSVDMSKPEE